MNVSLVLASHVSCHVCNPNFLGIPDVANITISHIMKPLQQKLSAYDAPQRAMAAGVYPYFRAIESEQDTEVIMNGRKVLMFGSNSYMGLTNHPKVIEAAGEATKK